MVDETNNGFNSSASADSSDTPGASEEMFLRGDGQDESLRKKADEEALKLEDSAEELNLQNIQRGSEKLEHPNKGTAEESGGAVSIENVQPKAASESVFQSDEQENLNLQAAFNSESQRPDDNQLEQRENNDQDSRRVLFNEDSENNLSGSATSFVDGTNSGVSASDKPLAGNEVASETSVLPVNNSEELINRAPDAGDDIDLNVNEGASLLSGELIANDVDPAAQLSYAVADGISIPEGFSLTEAGIWQFDAQHVAYDHLNVGDTTILTIPVTVTDEHGATDISQIQITIQGTNDAPVADASVVALIDEGAISIVGQLTSNDIDSGATASFAVSEGTTAPDGFTIHADGAYSFDPTDNAYDHLNVGDSTTLTIPVTVTDDNGATDTSQIQITVTGSNDAPTAIVFTGAVLDENSTSGTVVAQMSTQDVDAGDTFSYSLLDDASGLFEISGNQIVVKAGAEVDFESSASHEISVQVTDANGASFTQDVTLTVNDINEAPTDIVFSSDSIDENSAAGTVVATLSTADEDSGESFSYTLNDASGLFELAGDQIVVKSGADIDFESAESHAISVEVTDSSGNTLTEDFTIQVNDLIENVAPEASDDTTENFVPATATLTAEFNFDDGVPSASLGSVTLDNNGQVGNSADFSNAKVEVSGLALNSEAGAQTTVSMWIQANPEGDWEMLAASDRYDMVMLDGDIGFNTSGGDLFGSDASELADGEWHHVVAVFTNGDVSQNKIYIDGVEQPMSQIQGTPNNSVANIDSSDGSLHFGSWGKNDNYRFSGSMDEVKVYDGVLSSDEVNSLYDIEATSVNWNGGALSSNEDVALVINPAELLVNDSDADGDVLSITSVQDAAHGSVEIDSDGNIVFTPEADYNGAASFSYTISDGNGGEDSATVTLNVVSVNDVPVIDIVNTITVDEDGSQVISYSTSDIDSSNVALSGEAENGSVMVNDNGTITFTPNADFFGDDTITLTATDNSGGITTQEINVSVTPVEDAPDASDDTTENFVPATATLTAEFNFDDGVPSASLGSVTLDNNGQVGNSADFSNAKVEVSGLALNSEAGAQTTVSMWIQANPEGDWEMLAASDRYDMVMLNGDIGFNTSGGDLFGSDASELADGEWHHVVAVFTNGDVSQNKIYIDGVEQPMSQIQGTPNNSVANIDSSDGSLHFGSWGKNDNYRFSGSMDEVKVYDGVLSSDEISSLHTLESANVKWDATTLSTNEDVALVIEPATLLANDVDVDGDSLSIVSVQDAQNGSVEIDADGNIVFTPVENYNGEATFSYTVDDGKGNTDTASVNLNVESVNDAPVITITDTTITEDVSQVIANANDIDGSINASSLSSEHGTLALANNGDITYTPDADYNGTDTVSLSITDDTGATTTQIINLTIDPTQDNPVAVDDVINTEINHAISLDGQNDYISTDVNRAQDFDKEQGSSFEFTMTFEGDPNAGYQVMLGSDNGEFAIFKERGSNEFGIQEDFGSNRVAVNTTAIDAFDGEEHHIVYVQQGDQRILYIDGQEQLNFTSTVEMADSTINIGGEISGQFPFAGTLDNVKFFNTAISAEDVQTLYEGESISSDNLVAHYNFEGDTLAQQLSDKSGNGHDGTAHGSPEIVEAEQSVNATEDTSLTINSTDLLANDTDADGDSLTITDVSITDSSHGSVALNADGNIIFTPETNYNGEASFIYTVSDGSGNTDTATVTLNVSADGMVLAPTADITTASDSGVSSSDNITSENTPTITGSTENAANVTATYVDGSGDTQTLGTATADANGQYSITSNALPDGEHSITITATDTAGGMEVTTQHITVDTQAPTVTVDALVTSDNTPTITGTVSDPDATVSVTINNVTYEATNNGDGSWTLPDNTISNIDNVGIHDIQVTATDIAGNVAADTSSNELNVYKVTDLGGGENGTAVTFKLTGDPNNQQDVGAGSPQYQILVNGETFSDANGNVTFSVEANRGEINADGTGLVTNVPEFELVTLNVAEGIDINSVSIKFINDAWDGSNDNDGDGILGEDRNLVVDQMNIGGNINADGSFTGGATLQAEDTATTQYVRSDGADVSGRETMPWSGEMTFFPDGVVVEMPEAVNEIRGTGSSETLDGTDAADHIWGEGGHDTINAGAGDDTIEGGTGNDTLNGGEGNDQLIGGTGNDHAYGGEGNDTYVMNPFDGNDYFSGGEGGGWTDAIDLSAVAANDSDNPWTVEVDGVSLEYDMAASALELNPDTAGVVTFNDGSELSFEGVERIEW